MLLGLVAASYSSDKGGLLEQASQRVNGLRYLLRLAKDLHLLSMDGYGFAVERLDEIGRMVAGWLRATTLKR